MGVSKSMQYEIEWETQQAKDALAAGSCAECPFVEDIDPDDECGGGCNWVCEDGAYAPDQWETAIDELGRD